MILTAKKYGGPAALTAGLVDAIADPEDLFEKGVKMAQDLVPFGNDRKNFKCLKEEMYKTILDACFNKGLAVGIKAEGGPAITPKL